MNRREYLLSSAAAVAALASPAWAATGAAFPFEKSRAAILGHDMAYVDTGAGDPIVFLHGNPTSSYLWRNILPGFVNTHRVIAPDLIGMGDSAKPDIAYTYADHAAHLHGLLDSLDLEDVTLVIHDWGSALGLDWASQNPDRVRAIAFMEAILPPALPFASYEAMGPLGEMFQAWRTPGVGEQMILQDNMFIDEVLAKIGVATPLSPDVVSHYNAYYPSPESRLPILQWPREVPIGGEPAYVVETVKRYADWFYASDLPKLLFYAEPGALIPPAAAAYMQDNMVNLTTVNLGPGMHYLQEDHPEAITKALATWLNTI